jgi:NAD(P)-dependent dehydrogenase (short-subunit alcohol dehydrogenase family)
MDLSTARHAFITGGASGIGLGIAGALAARGISITIADINQGALDELFAARPKGMLGIALDIRNRNDWLDAKARSESAFGPVDILINNAGIAFDGRELADMDPPTFDQVIAVDLTGVFNGVHTFAAGMRARGAGHIVNTASIMGLTAGAATMGAYSIAKSGVVALSEALRGEMAPHGIGVSVLCPGFVASNLRANTVKLGVAVREIRELSGAGNAAMSPATAGEIVARGIARNLPYIITHPHYLEHIEKRMAAIRESFAAAAEPLPA